MSDVLKNKPYLLAGSNIRFLAENAVSHGHNVHTLDYYGDWDTRKLGPNNSIMRDGDGQLSMMTLARFAQEIENNGVVPGPGFENDIPALSYLKKSGELLGCRADSMRMARDPVSLTKASGSWGFEYAKTSSTRPEVSGETRVLVKPAHSLGGGSIRFIDDTGEFAPGKVYYQQFVEGMPSSAVVVSNRSEAAVLGVMTQLTGDPAFGASGFRFAGNVFPHPFTGETIKQVEIIAEALTLEFDLCGLWGFDFIFNGGVVLIEVNPRPTSGMGLLGAATINDLLGMHLASVRGEESPAIIDPGPSNEYTGSARIFAKADSVFRDPEKWYESGARDIPDHGDFIAAGSPVLTVFASGVSYSDVMEGLKAKADSIYKALSKEPAATAG